MSDLYPGTRVGEIIDMAVRRYNAARSGADGTLPETHCLDLINECLQDDLSLEDYFCTTALLDITAEEDYIDLLEDFPTIRRMLSLTWAQSGALNTPFYIQHITNYGELEAHRQSSTASQATNAYCYFGYKIWWINTPSATQADALKMLYSYRFPKIVIAGEEDDGDTPEQIPNLLFVAYIMKEMLLADSRKSKAGDLFTIWNDRYKWLKREVLKGERSGSASIQPSRWSQG